MIYTGIDTTDLVRESLSKEGFFEDRVFLSSFLTKHQHTGKHEACFLSMLSEVTLWPVHAVANLVWALLVLPLVSLVMSGPVPLAIIHELN